MSFQCPSCNRQFSTYMGVKVHHKKVHGTSIAGETYICKVCGKEFTDCRAQGARRKTCSYECRNIYLSQKLSQKISLECEICGKKFDVPPSKAKKQRFCSKKCEAKWKSIAYSGRIKSGKKSYICQQCGKEFQDDSYARKRIYCSKKCAAEALKVRVTSTCDYCGKEFSKTPNIMKRSHRYCSYECFTKDSGESDPEKAVRKFFEQNNIPFVQEWRVPNTRLHGDFYLDELNLVLEIDGKFWHDGPLQKKFDKKKERICSAMEIGVLRLDSQEVRKWAVDKSLL